MDELQARIEAIGDQLRAKISSKFQTSTFLAGLGFAVLTIQITVLWQSQKVPLFLPASISLMVVSICLYIAAVVKLDGLTVPKRFWEEEDRTPRDPDAARLAYLEDEDLWKLRKQMVFYWTSLTLVATGLTAVSLALMLLPFSSRELTDDVVNEAFLWTVVLLGCMGVYFIVLHIVVLRLKAKNLWRLTRARD